MTSGYSTEKMCYPKLLKKSTVQIRLIYSIESTLRHGVAHLVVYIENQSPSLKPWERMNWNKTFIPGSFSGAVLQLVSWWCPPFDSIPPWSSAQGWDEGSPDDEGPKVP
jgi:hypothetical protein